MSHIQGWRFLVSRNQFLDYLTVVAPDFMCQANIASLLAKVAEEDPANRDCIYYREIHGSKSGDLTLIYRVIEAQARDINIETEGVIKDSFGREIYLIEGIVTKGIQNKLSITLKDLESNHQQLINTYRDFWEWVSPQPAIPSQEFVLQFDGNPLHYIWLSEYIISSPSTKTEKFYQRDYFNSTQILRRGSFIFDKEVYLSKFISDSELLIHQYDTAVILFKWSNGEKKTLIRGIFNRSIRQTIVDTDSRFICTANVIIPDRNILKIWDLNSSTERDIGENSVSELGRVNAIAFTYDGGVIATDEKSKLSSSVPIKLLDTKTGGIRGELSYHTSDVKCIEASPFDDIFASGDREGFIKIWNWKTQEVIGTLTSNMTTVNALAFSPREKILVSSGDDGIIKITNYGSGVKDQGLLGELSDWGVNALAFSPNGQMVASGGDDGKVKLWDIKNRKLVYELPGHGNSVMSVSFSPNGKFLASGSKDCTVLVWQLT